MMDHLSFILSCGLTSFFVGFLFGGVIALVAWSATVTRRAFQSSLRGGE